jgi:hypothetical protein
MQVSIATCQFPTGADIRRDLSYILHQMHEAKVAMSMYPGRVAGPRFIRPDGVITGRLRSNVPDVLISAVDTREKLCDSTAAWRYGAMRGIFHGGELVRDRRSENRKRL